MEANPMKNDLTCPVVRDLLPSYVEGLTAPETAAAVEAHVASCPDCAARLAAMRAPEEAPPAEAKEVDYLKAVKRRTWKRVLLAVVCTVALVLAGTAAKLFLIGEPIGSVGTGWIYDPERQTLHLQVNAVESAVAYKDWAVRREGDAVRITARKVLVSPLYRDGSYETDISLADGVRSVYLGEDLIWQDGVSISPAAAQVYAARTPYVGDAAALGRIVKLLNGRLPGGFSSELQTAREPYGWTLVSSVTFPPEGEAHLNARMETVFAPLLLALVDNLGEVSWTYQTEEGNTVTRTVTLAEADAALPELAEAYNRENGAALEARESVKDYMASEVDFQQLWNMLELY